MISKPNDGEKRGLYFICFNANIGRPFELMQQTWVVNPKVAGLYEDPDPFIGNPEVMGNGTLTPFTELATPVRKKVNGIPRFANINGEPISLCPELVV